MTEKAQPTSKTPKWNTEERTLLKATESWVMMRDKIVAECQMVQFYWTNASVIAVTSK